MANTCGKSLTQESERRLVESLRAARLRLFDTPTADILRRLFGERRLVNGAPQRRDETTGRDFESDGQEAELGTSRRPPCAPAWLARVSRSGRAHRRADAGRAVRLRLNTQLLHGEDGPLDL